MRHLIIRICCLLLIISSIGIVTPQTAHAAIDLTQTSRCNLGNSQYVWGGGADIHPNGLLYISRTVAPVANAKTNGYIAIYAIDPNVAVEGTCPVVASYLDTVDDYTTLSVVDSPSVLAKDSQGNLYIGKSTKNSYRLLYIPNSATVSKPFEGIVAHNVVSSPVKKQFSLFSALGVTENHAMISMNSWNGGEPIFANYTIVPTAQIKDNSTTTISNAIWNSLGQVKLGLRDSIIGMPDGRFFVSALLSTNILGAAFINPVTGIVTNALDQSKPGLGTINCRASNLHFGNVAYCGYPTVTIGLDKNLYFLAYVDGYSAKSMVAMRYNPNTKSWSGIGNSSAIMEIPAFNDKEPTIGGGKITADVDGNVMIAVNGKDLSYWAGYKMTVAFLNKKTNNWTVLVPNVNSVGKPDINFVLINGAPRISVVGSINGLLYWTIYRGPINIASTNCDPNVVVEGGSYYVNKASISGTIYTADTCKASRYVVAQSTSATPVDPPTAPIKSFSPDNGNFSVSGLVPGLNYVHVRLYDTTAAIEKWVTNSVYVDTNATVQASVTLQNGNDAPNFKDTWSMRASSYTANEYTRSSIGTIRVTGVTDPSGLASYAINDQPAVSFDTNNVNKSIPVNFNSITSTVGISLTLTDGAGNTEIRGIRPLTYDVEPPSISVDPTPTFTATATTGVFSGTIGLTGGTITDDLYSASGRQYWGVWVANAKCVGDVVSGCPTDTASQLRWGAVPVTDPTSIPWNLLHGLNQVPSSGLYRTYIRFLDGAGNASTTAVTVDTTVTMTTNKIYMPLNFSQR